MQNYIEAARQRLARKVHVKGELLDLYTLLVFTKGVDCTLKDVHDAWSVWTNLRRPDHRSLIPFEQLTVEVQELDREYADGIIETAREMRLWNGLMDHGEGQAAWENP